MAVGIWAGDGGKGGELPRIFAPSLVPPTTSVHSMNFPGYNTVGNEDESITVEGVSSNVGGIEIVAAEVAPQALLAQKGFLLF